MGAHYSVGRRWMAAVGMLLGAGAAPALAQSAGPELWFYNQTNLAVQANVDTTKNLITRASAAGYKYMMLADTKLAYDGDTSLNAIWDPNWGYYTKIRDVISYGKSKGITVVPSSFDLGRAENWMLPRVNQNFASGQKVTGANYTVAGDGRSLIFNPQNPNLVNNSFVGSTGWSLDAGRVSIDTSTGHTDSSSLKVIGGGGRGWGIQTLTVQPNRQYHVSYWVKTSGLVGDAMVKMYDANAGRFRESHEGNPALDMPSTAGWTKKDYVFNSAGSTQIQLRMGDWGGSGGTMWFDDVQVEEIGLHNLVRNSSSPLKLYSGATVYSEGTDFNPIQEPYSKLSGMTFRLYKTPLTPTLPTGTKLTPGQQVKLDYDAVQPVYADQYGGSINEQGVKDYYARNIAELRKTFQIGAGQSMPGYMMGGFDELRHGASSTEEIASGKTGGELLAAHFKATYDLIRAQDPTAPILVWNDLFDPNHNAKDKFYLWGSTLANSWAQIPDDVTIVNWMNTKASLDFFAGLGNEQLMAGYYDRVGQGYNQAWNEVLTAKDTAGVRGLMYTTWGNNYGDLESYAAGAQAAWAQYIPEPSLGVVVFGLAGLLLRRR